MSTDARDTARRAWLTVDQSAEYVQAGARLIYNEVSAGRLRAARIGGRRQIRIRPEWLDEWLELSAGNRG